LSLLYSWKWLQVSVYWSFPRTVDSIILFLYPTSSQHIRYAVDVDGNAQHIGHVVDVDGNAFVVQGFRETYTFLKQPERVRDSSTRLWQTRFRLLLLKRITPHDFERECMITRL
jgi:hypothetical protein